MAIERMECIMIPYFVACSSTRFRRVAMKTCSFIPVVSLFLIYPPLFAQSREDVVYFKNGSQVHGQVLEQWPGVSIKIRFNDGTIQVYRMSDVAKSAQFD